MEPPSPDLSGPETRLKRSSPKLARRLKIGTAFVLLGAVVEAGSRTGGGSWLVVFGLWIAAWGTWAVVGPRIQARSLRARAADHRRRLADEYRQACIRWDEQIAQHDAGERHRIATTPLLFPIAPRSGGRIDVAGGTPEGWAALLTTMGSSVLADGGTVLMVDLSGQDVTAPLFELAEQVGGRPSTAAVPTDLERTWLLGDLAPRELAELLAQAIDARRGPGAAPDLCAMDAELIHTVARRLGGPVGIDRLAAGIRVLRSTYDEHETLLNAAEMSALTDRVDLIDRSERMRDEMGFVEAQLGLLADRDGTGVPGTATALWPESGLGVVRSDEHDARRKSLLDRVVFGAVAHHLATVPPSGRDPLLVVIGADEIDRRALESMTRTARVAGVRLVYLFEHLRDAAEQLLGGGDSASVLMRLGNGHQAATAAEFVGRGHSFQLSQISRQYGRTDTTGVNSGNTYTSGGSDTTTTGRSRSRGRGGPQGWFFPGFARNWSRSLTDSWSRAISDSWSTAEQTGESSSQSTSQTDGEVLQRSYEFTVEPTRIQTLEPTAFLLVDTGPDGRRVRMADCFPGTVSAPRLSHRPR